MSRDYEIDINIDLDTKKINDLEKLVELYSKIGTLAVTLGEVNPNLSIKIGEDVKKTSEWIESLTDKFYNLRKQYFEMIGANSDEQQLMATAKLANLSMDYRAKSTNWLKFLDPYINSYATNQPIAPLQNVKQESKEVEKNTKETAVNLEKSVKEAEKLEKRLRKIKEQRETPSKSLVGLKNSPVNADDYISPEHYEKILNTSRDYEYVNKDLSSFKTKIEYIDKEGQRVVENFYETINKGEIEFNGSVAKIKDNVQKRAEGLDLTKQQFDDLSKSIKNLDQNAIKSFLLDADINGKKLSETLKINAKILDKSAISIDNVKNKFTVTYKEANNIRTINSTLNTQAKQIDMVTNSVKALNDESKKKFDLKFIAQLFATRLLLKILVNMSRQVWRNIMDIDKALIDMSKVLDMPMKNLRAYAKEALDIANRLGATQKDVLNVTTEIVKLGFSLETAKGLTEIAIRGMRVGDFKDATMSVEYLTSVLKGFQLQVDGMNAERVLDMMNEVANNTTISMEKIGEGMKRFSAVMNQVGVSIEESMGLLVGAFDIIRDEGKVANALNTISLRMRGVSEDGDELTGFLPKLEGMFNSLSLSLYDAEGNLKSTYDIFKDLALIWKDLSQEQQVYLLEEIAGKRNVQVATAIIQNWQEVERTVKLAKNSVGSSSREFEKYLGGLEATVSRLKNSISELYQKVLNSTILKFVIELANSIIYITNFLINKYTLILAGIAAVGVGVAYLTTQFITATTWAGALNIALTALGAVNPFVWIGTAIVAIPLLYRWLDSIPSSFERLEKSIAKINEQIYKQQKLLDELSDMYEKYKDKGIISTSLMSIEDAKKHNEWIKSVRETSHLKDLADKFDLYNLSLREYLALEEEIAKRNRENSINKSVESINETLAGIEKTNNNLRLLSATNDKNVQKSMNAYSAGSNQLAGFFNDKKIKKTKDELQKYNETLNQQIGALKALGFEAEVVNGVLRYWIPTIEEQNKKIDQTTLKINALKNEIKELKSALELLNAQTSIWNDGSQEKLQLLEAIKEKELEEFKLANELYNIQKAKVESLKTSDVLYKKEVEELNKLAIDRFSQLNDLKNAEKAIADEKEKQYNKQIELIKKVRDESISAIEAERKALRDARNEAKDDKEFEKVQENIRKLNLSLLGLESDDSQSAKQLRSQLRKQLEEEKSKLDDMLFEQRMREYDKQIEQIEKDTEQLINEIEKPKEIQVTLDDAMIGTISNFINQMSDVSKTVADALSKMPNLSQYQNKGNFTIDGIEVNVVVPNTNASLDDINKTVEKSVMSSLNKIAKKLDKYGLNLLLE